MKNKLLTCQSKNLGLSSLPQKESVWFNSRELDCQGHFSVFLVRYQLFVKLHETVALKHQLNLMICEEEVNQQCSGTNQTNY